MSDQLDMMFISAHPNGSGAASGSPVPGQTANSRRPWTRRGTMTGTAMRRWPSYVADLDAGRARIRRSGRSRARPRRSAWATPLMWTLWSWPRWWARMGWAARCSPGTGRGPVGPACPRQRDRAGRRGPGPAHRQPGGGRDGGGGPARGAGRVPAAARGGGVHPPPRGPAGRRDGPRVPRGCRDGSSPTPSSAWNWSPPPRRPGHDGHGP